MMGNWVHCGASNYCLDGELVSVMRDLVHCGSYNNCLDSELVSGMGEVSIAWYFMERLITALRVSWCQ